YKARVFDFTSRVFRFNKCFAIFRGLLRLLSKDKVIVEVICNLPERKELIHIVAGIPSVILM
ncbi:MAG: hypothetical protein ACK55Z_04825, partial [bacterium]